MKAQGAEAQGRRGVAKPSVGAWSRPVPRALTFLTAAAALLTASGCLMPVLSQDGQLVFTPGAARGSAVLITAGGVEYTDRSDIQTPQVRTSPYDAYQPPRGFLLPHEGRFRHTAGPVRFEDSALSVVLRSGEALAPSWGGEMLLRFEVTAKGGEEHAPLRFVVVLDGPEEALDKLGCQAITGLLASDRVTVFDSRGARKLLPTLPATQRPLLVGAIERRRALTGGRDLAATLAAAGQLLADSAGEPALAKVLVLTGGDRLDSASVQVKSAVAALEAAGAQVLVAGPSDQLNFPEASPAARELSVSFASSPAPARLLDSSGGKRAALLDADWLFLGHLSAGQGRSEIVRVTLPPFLNGEKYRLAVRVHYTDPASGEEHSLSGQLDLRYSDDPDEIASYRAADVIGYGSALSLVGKIERAFLGTASASSPGMRNLLDFQERSLLLLGSERGDGALHEQAQVLRSLVWAIDAPPKAPETPKPPETPLVPEPAAIPESTELR
jgi:hypothetical protein